MKFRVLIVVLGAATPVASLHLPAAQRGHVVQRAPITLMLAEEPTLNQNIKVRPAADAGAALLSSPVKISDAVIEADGKTLAVTFSDGLACRFHSLWLRDACRDDNHVAKYAGERLLTATPVGPSGVHAAAVTATLASIAETGDLHVDWGDQSFCDHEMALEPPEISTFSAAFLRSYAEVVAEPIAAASVPTSKVLDDELAWLQPYAGLAHAPAPSADAQNLFRNDGSEHFPVYDYDDVLDPKSPANLRMLRDVVEYGGVIIDGCADPGEPALHHLADTALGGLQKDPSRPVSNWKIVRKDGATSVSYDHLKRLNAHTDSSIPPHGVPALCLLFHYAAGTGTNTLSDGFAVAQQLRKDDPEAFDLLCQYGYDAERDFVASRSDSTQEFNRGLLVSTQTPVLQLDAAGELARVQYNEVFRMPLTLPFDVFPQWYAAFDKFVGMVHSEEFERKIPMSKGRFCLVNNWRVLHGRAGGTVSSDRVLVGGTILREAFYSTARRLTRERRGCSDEAQEEELVLRRGAVR